MYVADFNAMLLNVFLDVVTDSNVLLDMLQKWPQFSDNLSLLYYKGPMCRGLSYLTVHIVHPIVLIVVTAVLALRYRLKRITINTAVGFKVFWW